MKMQQEYNKKRVFAITCKGLFFVAFLHEFIYNIAKFHMRSTKQEVFR